MTRITFDEMKATIKSAFLRAGMPEGKAEVCARVHTESSRDGVYSHGLNRVERFVDYIDKNLVDVHAEPTLEINLGAMEIYNGNMGPGILNAIFAMNRATEIAEKNGLGLVSLNNTTHCHYHPTNTYWPFEYKETLSVYHLFYRYRGI